MKFLLFLSALTLLLCGAVSADTVSLKDGHESNGVIVEDYHDRVIISTEKGEICHLKKDISKISYDADDENLVKLGAYYKDKGDYRTALYYYQAAHKANPNLKAAQEGTLLMNNLIFHGKEDEIQAQVALKQDTEEHKGVAGDQTAVSQGMDEKARLLEKLTGISLANSGWDIMVTKVARNSPAASAGIKESDIIVSIWGRLLRYTTLKDAYDLFLGSKVNEIRLTVSRTAAVVPEKGRAFGGASIQIGGKLAMEFDGLIIKKVASGGAMERAGIAEGDSVISIGSTSTRYLPLESVLLLIENSKDDTVNFQIQREVTLWKQ